MPETLTATSKLMPHCLATAFGWIWFFFPKLPIASERSAQVYSPMAYPTFLERPSLLDAPNGSTRSPPLAFCTTSLPRSNRRRSVPRRDLALKVPVPDRAFLVVPRLTDPSQCRPTYRVVALEPTSGCCLSPRYLRSDKAPGARGGKKRSVIHRNAKIGPGYAELKRLARDQIGYDTESRSSYGSVATLPNPAKSARLAH